MANKKVNHTERSHALLSASGASRWMNCTPSARLEEQFPEDDTSVFAEEGTLAHEISDLKLQQAVHKSVDSFEMLKLREHKLYQEEMEEFTDAYVNYCLEQLQAARKESDFAEIRIEEKIDLRHYIPEGFGTNDCIIIGGKVMEVIDLKYGKGVRVSAQNNPQLKLYALGSLLEVMLLTEIETVKMTIVQPRLDHIDSFQMSASDLIKWGEEVVKPTAKKAFAGEGDAVPGDWCRWCKAKPTCRALADHHLSIAKHEFQDPALLDDSELLDIFGKLDTLTMWADAVKGHILTEALKGKKWEGLKVVEGRSIRKVVKPQELVKELEDQGFSPADFMESKLAAIGKLEKLVGKKEFAELAKDYIEKPTGKPTLAPADDKRPEFSSAENDFYD